MISYAKDICICDGKLYHFLIIHYSSKISMDSKDRKYLTALLDFNNFLEAGGETAETVLQSILEGNSNVYKLFPIDV